MKTLQSGESRAHALLPLREKVAEVRMRRTVTFPGAADGYDPPHPPHRGTFSHQGRREDYLNTHRGKRGKP